MTMYYVLGKEKMHFFNVMIQVEGRVITYLDNPTNMPATMCDWRPRVRPLEGVNECMYGRTSSRGQRKTAVL